MARRIAKKNLTIRFKGSNRIFNKAFEKWLFSFGFVWKDTGLGISRDLGENDYFIEIDLNANTMKYISFFIDVEDFVDIPIVMEVESEYDEHPVYLQLKKLFNEFRRDTESVDEVIENKKKVEEKKQTPQVKYPVFVKHRGSSIVHLHDMRKSLDNI